jgi:hypothetical protein
MITQPTMVDSQMTTNIKETNWNTKQQKKKASAEDKRIDLLDDESVSAVIDREVVVFGMVFLGSNLIGRRKRVSGGKYKQTIQT